MAGRDLRLGVDRHTNRLVLISTRGRLEILNRGLPGAQVLVDHRADGLPGLLNQEVAAARQQTQRGRGDRIVAGVKYGDAVALSPKVDVEIAAGELVLSTTDRFNVITLTPEGAYGERRAVPAGYMYVDGIVGDIGHGVLRDRKALAEEGVVVVILTVDTQTGEVVTGPEIVTRGWVYAPEAEGLIEDAKQVVLASIKDAIYEGATDFDTLRRHARKSLGKFIDERTRRRPIVIPVVMEV
jgi:hypothetical protein